MKDTRGKEGGYVAMTTTLIISLILLTMLAQNGFVGWHARFLALNREKKHQANAFAGGCMEFAVASMIKDASLKSATFVMPVGWCEVRVVDVSNLRAAEFRVQVRVGGAERGGVAYTNIRVVANLSSGEIISLQETPDS
ncbi:MAG TPA: hypothetical protein VJK53_02825 [Candidatus Paceibacterota bacterium]